MTNINTIKSFTQLISLIVAAYKGEKYAFIDENFIDFSAAADKQFPALLFNIERVESTFEQVTFTFTLTVIRPKEAYDSCTNLDAIKDGTNPVDTDEAFITMLLQVLRLAKSNCGKYKVTNGSYTGALQLGTLTHGNQALAGAYAFVVRGIAATIKQPQYTNQLLNEYFELSAIV